ncbi:MAG TPA: hypothetical protein VFB62_14285 [Polyangiaceae bacterium]|nr:hypothetical protein [Polyangiaceae bacterium]
MRRWWLALALMLIALPARAQDDTGAEIHFRAGRAFAERGRWEEACREFAASMKAAPSVGAQLNLGLCNDKLGRLMTAQRAYLEAARMAAALGEENRAEGAREHAKALDARIPRLRIRLDKPVAAGTTVELDGNALSEPAVPVAVDPGAHRVVVRAPGMSPWSGAVDAEEGVELIEVDVPPLAPPHEAKAPPPKRDTGLRTAGIVVLGGGVLGIAIGAVFGVLAMEDRDDAASDAALCNPDNLCSRDGEALIEGARVKARIATAAFVVGGAAVAGGIALFVVHGIGGEQVTGRLTPLGARLHVDF